MALGQFAMTQQELLHLGLGLLDRRQRVLRAEYFDHGQGGFYPQGDAKA